MREIETIFFDLDGTLVDSREDIVTAVNYAFKETGAPTRSHEDIISYVGMGVRDLIIRSLGEEYSRLTDRCLEIAVDFFREHCADKSTLYPHVREILEFFKGKDLLIVTNRMTDLTKKTLNKLGIDKYFKKIIGGDDENCLKPEACPLLNALDEVSGDEETSIMVGDMDIDVLAGRNAGIYTCAVTYGIGDNMKIEKASPDYIIDDIIQLKNIIK